MTYPLRLFEPGTVYFVTNRTMQSRFFLRPTPEVHRIIGGVLARACNRFDVELFAFVFASNHYHLLLRAGSAAAVSDFVGYLQANMARRIGKLIDWTGRFWHRRFSASPVLDDEALEDRVRYILAHGVKEGLVESVSEWPGLSCCPELAFGVIRNFDWVDEAELNEARRYKLGHQAPPARADFTTRYRLPLQVLPCWQHLDDKERCRRVRELIRDVEQGARHDREGKGVLGREAVLAQNPLDAPEHTKNSPRPLCHASRRETYVSFRKVWDTFVAAYREASARFRQGVLGVEFPPFACHPPLRWGWRLTAAAEMGAA